MPKIAWQPKYWDFEKSLILAAWFFAGVILFVLILNCRVFFSDDSLAKLPQLASKRSAIFDVAPDIDSVIKADLFGFKDNKNAGAIENAPKTQLALQLKGVIVSQDEKKIRAIIASSGKPEESYRIGDILPGQATLHQVLRDRVVLRVKGHYEILWLFEETLRLDWLKPIDKSNESGAAFNTKEVKNMLSDFRTTILKRSPMAMAEMILINPEFQGGEMLGVRVFPGPNAKPFEMLGLKSNDLVHSVNGIELNSLAKASMLLAKLKEATDLTVIVLREGQKLNFYYEFGEE